MSIRLLAVRFYEKNGFARLKTLPHFYTIDGQACDAYLYARHFNGGRRPMALSERIVSALHSPLRALCCLMSRQMSLLSRRLRCDSAAAGAARGGRQGRGCVHGIKGCFDDSVDTQISASKMAKVC